MEEVEEQNLGLGRKILSMILAHDLDVIDDFQIAHEFNDRYVKAKNSGDMDNAMYYARLARSWAERHVEMLRSHVREYQELGSTNLTAKAKEEIAERLLTLQERIDAVNGNKNKYLNDLYPLWFLTQLCRNNHVN